MNHPPITHDAPRRIALIAALYDEVQAVRRRLGLAAQGERWVGRVESTDVVAIVTGPGLEAAARATSSLLDAEPMGHVLHIGFAGGLDPALQPGAIVEAGRVRDESGSVLTLSEEADAPLLLSLNRVLSTPAEKRIWWESTGAATLDTESYAVAAASAARSTPCRVIRAVCDDANSALPEDVSQWVDERGRRRTARVLRSMAGSPSTVAAVRRLARAARLAGDALADAVERAVPELVHSAT